MNMNNKYSELTEKQLRVIVSASYENMGFIKRIKFKWFFKKNPEAKVIYDEFKKTSDLLKRIPVEKCPDEVVKKVNNRFGISGKNSRSILNDILYLVFSRPVFSSLSITIIIVGILSTFIFERNNIDVHYTANEIGLANKQVKESLALIGAILSKTEKKITNDILTSRVGKPIKEGINTINYLFEENGGNKNEKAN